jgi:hypothetical protein
MEGERLVTPHSMQTMLIRCPIRVIHGASTRCKSSGRFLLLLNDQSIGTECVLQIEVDWSLFFDAVFIFKATPFSV